LDIVVKKDIDLEQQKSEKLFEIYPFLGINPVNYDLDEINMMFEKYFYGYTQDTPEERKTKLYNKLGTVETTMEELISEAFHRENPGYFSYIFSGIKLYPPLGFNPWPIGNPEAFEKVNLLYRKCLEHRLPITVHCSDGGFKASKLSKVYTNPANEWQSVLNHPEYSKLKINFAHLGNQSNGSSAWQHSIIQSIHKNRNVFTDCSCVAIDDDDFKKIGRMMCDEKISQNMLFGTDFLINLIWSNSYNDYLYNFLKTEILPINQKIQMCSDNPENFLFG